MKLISISFALLLFGQWTTSFAQTANDDASTKAALVTEIKTYTAGVDRFTKSRKPRTYLNTSETDKPNWHLLKGKPPEQIDESCDVWLRDGKVVEAFFGLTSSSGDWYHFIKYYYRPDGSLAKISARLNTFYGNVSVLRDRYYDGIGKLLKSTIRYLDLQTHKPVKKPDFQDMPIQMYSKVSALPFSKLL